ncbi:unnamed protein product [Calypogeia fissa]
MDELWHLKANQGLNRNYSQSSPASASLNQMEMLSGSFGHPFVQQEVCVIERTIRQESLGANLLNFGLPGPHIKSVRGDVGNSLLALVPGSQHQVRSSYQSVVTPQSPLLSSNPQAYQMGSVSSPGVGSWPGHLPNMSAGTRVSGVSSGLGVDSSMNMSGRDVTLPMLGREANLTQYLRMTGEQDCMESNLTRTSGNEVSKHNDNENDISGQSSYPQWLTEIISSRQRGQIPQSPSFASGGSFPRVGESSRDGSAGMSSLTPLATALMREALVVCINYETGQKVGGELYLTQMGLLGVICSCHGNRMSVAKFTQHVGINTTNPGNVVAMDGTGESLVQWRKTLFCLYGIKVPYDNQGWNWSEGTVSESGPTKYKAVVTQSWQKEVDLSYSGEPLVKSRLTQVWDASVSPSQSANFPLTPSSATLGLSSNLGEGCVRNSRETFLKSLERAFRSSSLEFGPCPSNVEDIVENVGRCQGLPEMHPGRNSSTEFINFISGSQQLMAGHTEQQVAVERQIAVGSRSFLKGLDLTWSERREALQLEKDNSLSNFELKLGQPSQQAQSVGPPASSAANQMQRVMQRGGQQSMQSPATSAAGLQNFSGTNRLFNQPSFENTAFMEPNHHNSFRVDSNRGMEGNGSVLVDNSSFKETEEVSTFRFVENLRERENILGRDAGQFPTGVRRWPSVGCVGNSFKSNDTSGMNCEHPAKRWAEEAQLRMGGAVRPVTQGHQDLDTVLNQEWMSKTPRTEDQATESSSAMAGRASQVCRGENMIHIQRNVSPPYRDGGGEVKEHFAYGDIITSRGAREGQGCAYVNNTKATTTSMEARLISKFAEDEDVYMRDANHTEPDRHRVNRTAGQGPVTHDCSSPRGRRLRSYQAATTQAYSCGANSMEEHSNQGCKAISMAGDAPLPISVEDSDGGTDKRFLNQEGIVEKPVSRESNQETFQWKEMGGIFVSGSDTIPDAAQDHMSSPQSPAEDSLANTGANVDAAVAASSKASDKQQPVSDVCSKSSENVMSELSDGIGAEEEVSNTHCIEKNPLGSAVVDEASGIGKCSSSDGVDMGLMPNLNMSSKDEHTPKDASPSSQGYPSLCNAKEVSRRKVKTTSRGGSSVKGPVARHMVEDVIVKAAKVEKKRRRTLKWKSLDAAIGAADSKRHKLSPSVNVAENFDSSQKRMEGSDISNCLGHKSVVGFSPSRCGKDSILQAFKIKVTQGNSAASNAEHGMEVNGGNSTDSLQMEERSLTAKEALVSFLPQSLHRRKAKRSGRPKPSKIKIAGAAQEDSRYNKSALSEMVAGNATSVDNLIVKEPAGPVGEMAASATKSLPKCSSTPKVQPRKTGRVLLRRPSPRNATRMVSLNDIMNKPEVVALTAPKASVAKDVVDLSALQDRSRALSSKENLKVHAGKNGKVCGSKDMLEAMTFTDTERTSPWTEGPNGSCSKEALKKSPSEGLKIKLCSSKSGYGVFSPNGGLQAHPARDGPKLSVAKQGTKISFLKNGSKAVSGKDGSKTLTCDESLKAGSPKRALKVSGPIASAVKENSKESYSKSTVRIPVRIDTSDIEALRACSKAAATKNRHKAPVAKIGMHIPASRTCSKVAVPNDSSKSVGAEDRLKQSSHKDVQEASGGKGLKTTTLKERLKTLASRDALQETFSFDIGISSIAKDVPGPSVVKDGSKVVPTDRLEAPSKAKIQGKALRKPNSSLGVAAISHGDQNKMAFQVPTSLKESQNAPKLQRQEVRKVRSLHELISDKSLPGPGTEVFEFHDEELESTGVPKQDSVNRRNLQSDATFSVPIHFTDSKCFVPRGERSPRGKPAKTNNLFLQRHRLGSMSGGKLGAEPVEIVVGRRFVQNVRQNVGTPFAVEKDVLTAARFCPVTPLKWSLQKSKNRREAYDGATSGAHVASSPSRANDLVDGKTVDKNRELSHKRAAEPELIDSPVKRQKFSQSAKASHLRSGILKVKQALPISITTTPTTSSVDVVGSKGKDSKKRPLTAEDDLDVLGRKKRCQRQKRIDCQVPEGVVECCVCGSSISEFLNQIVCCSGCPVKVHQACYGVKKIPNSAWFCRTCKATASQPTCVLCGYGGGAMTRAQKSKAFQKGLVKVWQEKINPTEKADISSPHSADFLEAGMRLDHSLADRQCSVETYDVGNCSVKGKPARDLAEIDADYLSSIERREKSVAKENLMPCNSVSSGLLDSTVVQWVHMVCALWMPGTRCQNNSTMGVFDVSGVTLSRRKMVCSICNRKGGACIQCRVVKCGVPFHPWCAHEKGLLRSEIVEDGNNSLEFNGKCLRHGEGGDLLNDPDVADIAPEEIGLRIGTSSSCARTEGYAGKLTLEERALQRRQATRKGSAAVSPEQVAAWLRINERKTCKARRFLKSVNSDQKTDHREYLRFKQEQGWRRLSVYKSGIHALGLYTSEFIGRGEMVVEYIGEIVGLRVADKREADYHSGKRMQYQGACYLFRIDRERIIDATRKGGIARFVNHSCSPNCVAKVICVKNQSKVVFFAQRDIYAGEEITYDYQFNFEQEGDKIPCFCGSATCRGTLN